MFIIYSNMTMKQACSSLAINITGNYTDLQVGNTINITCQRDLINVNFIFIL